MSKKHSEAMKKRWADPAYRAQKLAEMSTPEFHARKSEAIRAYWATDPPHHMLGRERRETLKATTVVTTRDIIWASGFLEGEGTFYNSAGAARRRLGTSYVSVYQVNKEPVERLLTIFGGSLSLRAARGVRMKPTWVWRASGSRARGIVLTVFPLMSQKRQGQIREALNCGR